MITDEVQELIDDLRMSNPGRNTIARLEEIADKIAKLEAALAQQKVRA